MRAHLTLKSSNAKTGSIPVSTTSRASCPPACPFRRSGCYADDYHLSMHWDKVTAGERGAAWSQFCDSIAALPEGTLWRHNQAGDLPRKGNAIDRTKLRDLIAANAGKRGFTYTHHALTRANIDALCEAAIAGFTVNLSADNLADADRKAATGLPVTVVLPTDQRTNTRTPAGRSVVVCPAITRDNVTCATCQLCARGDRDVIVGFPAHGSRAKRADAVARRTIPIAEAA